MHIHRQMPNMQAFNYEAANSERAAAARRAAETRKRLLSTGQAERAGIDGPDDLSPDEMAMIGRWMDSRRGQVLADDEYRPAGSGRGPGLDADLDMD